MTPLRVKLRSHEGHEGHSVPGILRALRVFVVIVFVVAAAPSSAAAADRYALIVTGASGGPQYAQKYENWRSSFVETLTSKFGYPEDRIIVLGEAAEGTVRKSTRENVRGALDSPGKAVTSARGPGSRGNAWAECRRLQRPT